MRNTLTETVFGTELDRTMSFADALSIIDDMDLLNIGELAERAISKRSGVAMCKKLTENIDLETGYQIKHARTHRRPTGYWVATISRNTTAPILAVITETCTKKQYYLHIPYSAHKHLTGNTIGISFGRDGYANSDWVTCYRVKSFDALCEIAQTALSH